MKRIASGAIGVDQGTIGLFSDFETGGDMWTGSGPRAVRKHVKFHQPFREAPVVHLSIALFDLDQKTNGRADLSSENITEEGFDAVFRTWGDTRVARIRASWIAIGEVSSEDDWAVD